MSKPLTEIDLDLLAKSGKKKKKDHFRWSMKCVCVSIIAVASDELGCHGILVENAIVT